MHWPRIHALAVSAGVRLRAKETEISAAPWALRLGKGLYFILFYLISLYGTTGLVLIRGKIRLPKVEHTKLEGHVTPNEDEYQKCVPKN